MKHSLESLPRRIFLDSCTAQTLRNYGGYIYEAEPIPDADRIHRMTDGIVPRATSAENADSHAGRYAGLKIHSWAQP
jgi:hypothetical protein